MRAHEARSKRSDGTAAALLFARLLPCRLTQVFAMNPRFSILRLVQWLLPAAPLTFMGCASPLPSEPPVPLTGTRWQLVSFTSMDDAQPALRPQDASRYTLAFKPDGQVQLQLDCNRGSSTWNATPGAGVEAGRTSGGLTLGALRSTRAACAPGSMAPQIERMWPYIRSFVIQDGRLHLSLMADGGIYTWAPQP